jgi:excisionase family DNA binding protein
MSEQAVTAAKLLTPEQVAERWGVRKSHVYRLCRERKVKNVRLGRYVRLREQDVEEFERNGGTDGE